MPALVRAVRGVEALDPVDAQPVPRPAAAPDHRDLDVASAAPRQAPERRRRAVADERAVSAGEHRAELEGAGERDRRDRRGTRPGIPAMQRSRSQPPLALDPRPTPAIVQLSGRDQPELLVRDPRDRRLAAAARVHKAPKLADRDDLGDISAWEVLMLPRAARTRGLCCVLHPGRRPSAAQDAPPTAGRPRNAPISCRVATKALPARGRPLPARHDPAAARGRPLPARHDRAAAPGRAVASASRPAGTARQHPLATVPHAGEVQPVRRRGPPRRRTRPPGQQLTNDATDRRPPPTSSIVPISTRIIWRMNASASIQNSSTSLAGPPAPERRIHLPREPLVVGLGRRERREVVVADQRRTRTPDNASTSSRCGHHSARPRSNTLRARRDEHPIAVRPARGVPPRIEPGSSLDTRQRRHISRQQRIQRPHRNRRPGIRSHLPPRMDPRVGATRDRQATPLSSRKITQRARSTSA